MRSVVAPATSARRPSRRESPSMHPRRRALLDPGSAEHEPDRVHHVCQRQAGDGQQDPGTGDDDYLRARKRRRVTAPDRVLLTGSRSILPRPGEENRTPSPSSTGRTYTRISSTRPRRRHWPATSAPRISRSLPPAASSAVATASPMSPVRYVTSGSGGSGGRWVRTNMGPEKG